MKLGSSADPDTNGKSSHFPASLGFKDNGTFVVGQERMPNARRLLVPVYDARGKPDFMFDKDSMKKISDLPAYNKGKTDVPRCKYIATVGYTVGSWKTKPDLNNDRVVTCASLNLQFVIIIGKVDMNAVA